MVRDRINKFVRAALRAFGYQINRVPEAGFSTVVPFWDAESRLNALYDEIRGERTVVSKNRCFMLYQLLKYASCLDGEVAEVGVYKGGTAKLLAKTAPHKNVYLFDTFTGLPAITEGVDLHRAAEFNDTSLSSVRSFLEDCPNITICPGLFPATASLLKEKSFCFMHIDVDIYNSVMDCLDFFYSRIVKGGVIVLDDYESRACPGVKKAVDEFFSSRKEYPITTTEIQCAIIKL